MEEETTVEESETENAEDPRPDLFNSTTRCLVPHLPTTIVPMYK